MLYLINDITFNVYARLSGQVLLDGKNEAFEKKEGKGSSQRKQGRWEQQREGLI